MKINLVMKAAVFDGKNISIKLVEKPSIQNSKVIIQVKEVGICGTDLAIISGDLPTPIPIILGHEFTGEIIEIGQNVEQSWLNKRVTSEINSNIDFDCYYCKRGLYSQCVSRKAIGIDIDGALVEYIALAPYLLHELPDSITYEEATFIEPLAAAYQTFEMMPISKDDKIMAIFGLGKLGLLVTQVASIKGLELIVIDASEKKLNLAKKFGAKYLINRLSCEDIPKEIRNLTKGLGADIVIDTSGNPDALSDVVESCRTRGKIHVKSTHGLETPINLTDIVVRELTLYSSRCGPFEKAIGGLESGKISVKDLISKKFKLDHINEAFESYKTDHDHIKTIVEI
ncbi:MAG: alcohol dehydrogenase catalytic domain-containing protein [Promethearchaeota archaeon]|nr:MAG: alcohol dehydrogenase catalytic domain-containing protein [Candidatus Lokiarchaeota archaeon]